jgi:lysyl-tRNA synthetase, class II
MSDTAQSTAEVVLGPDGEPLSKNALKKLQKAKEAEAKKAAKAAEKAAAMEAAGPSKPKIGGDIDDDVDPTKYFENRTNSLAIFEVSRLGFRWFYIGTAALRSMKS